MRHELRAEILSRAETVEELHRLIVMPPGELLAMHSRQGDEKLN